MRGRGWAIGSGIRMRLTYANVVSTLALFAAVGGGAYAATNLPANSVGTKQLKNGAVTGTKLDSKVIGLFKGQQGVQGPQGVAGPPGADGPQGATGLTGATGPQGAAGPKGDTGAKGDQGPVGLAPSASASAAPPTPPATGTPIGTTDTTLLHADITITQSSRIMAFAAGSFDAPASGHGGVLDCGLTIGPSGGSAGALGQRYSLTFTTLLGIFYAPDTAGGSVVESAAGTYTVSFVCKTSGTAGDIVFNDGDLGVVSAAS